MITKDQALAFSKKDPKEPLTDWELDNFDELMQFPFPLSENKITVQQFSENFKKVVENYSDKDLNRLF
jgi:hypothetical protein